jgi:hypothetical protein
MIVSIRGAITAERCTSGEPTNTKLADSDGGAFDDTGMVQHQRVRRAVGSHHHKLSGAPVYRERVDGPLARAHVPNFIGSDEVLQWSYLVGVDDPASELLPFLVVASRRRCGTESSDRRHKRAKNGERN